jgi:hypothetical protein
MLLALRGAGTQRLLWIDAICINQSDMNKKSWQVAMMARIYRNAKQVIAYLKYDILAAGALSTIDDST